MLPLALGVVIGIAALLRLLYLGGKSLWSDEVASLVIAKLSWAEFWRVVSAAEANMSFYYFLLHFWIRLGSDAFTVRLLSALAGVAIIPVIYALGKELGSSLIALVAASIITVNVFHIRYSQEARSYTLVAFLLALSYLCLLRSIKERGYSWGIGYVLSAALALYAHFFAALGLLAQVISFSLMPKEKIPGCRHVIYFLVVALLGLPLLWFVLARNTGQLDWVPVISLKGVYHFIAYLTGSGIQLAIAGLASGIAVKAWISAGRRERSVKKEWPLLLVLIWLVLPISLTLLLSLWKPIFSPRFLIVSLPAATLLIASGLARIRPDPLRYVLSALFLLGSIAPIRSYYAQPPVQDWKAAVGYLGRNVGANDGILFPDQYCRLPFDYYTQQHGLVGSFALVSPVGYEPGGKPHLWIISCVAAGTPPPPYSGAYRIEGVEEFNGIQIAELVRTSSTD